MNKMSKIALIAFVIAFISVMPCAALVLDKDYLQSKISEDLNRQYRQNNPDGAIIVKNVPQVSVDLKGSVLVIDSFCDFTAIGKSKIAKVVLSEEGKVLRTIAVPVEVVAYDMVLVTTREIARGEELNSNNTRFEKRNVENNAGNVIAENYDFSNMASRKLLKVGEIIDKRYLIKKTAVFRSAPVIAVFQSGGIRLSLEVIAMENGGIGDYIKVRSKEYNKVYQGRVISANQVLIQI